MFFGVSADKYKKIDSDSMLNKKKSLSLQHLRSPYGRPSHGVKRESGENPEQYQLL